MPKSTNIPENPTMLNFKNFLKKIVGETLNIFGKLGGELWDFKNQLLH